VLDTEESQKFAGKAAADGKPEHVHFNRPTPSAPFG